MFSRLLLMMIPASFLTATPTKVSFQSEEELAKALTPFSVQEVIERLEKTPTPLEFSCEPIPESRTVPLRNITTGNVLRYELAKEKLLTVYLPENPRAPHHVVIALNRLNIRGIRDVTSEENHSLFSMIRKITEIYKSVGINGFVIAQFDKPQLGHNDRYVVEMIPHLPGFGRVKNIADKIDVNRYILFRGANITPIICEEASKDLESKVYFWKEALSKESIPLTDKDIKISFPYSRYEHYAEEAQTMLRQHLLEILDNHGGKSSESSSPLTVPMAIPEDPQPIEVNWCPFCSDAVLQKQLVFEYKDVMVLYNIRKSPKAGCTFLLVPKNHKEKVYSLSKEEEENIHLVRQVLAEVLNESFPEQEVITYTQDDASTGQNVFHTHEHILSIDPNTIALSWTLQSINYNVSVSDKHIRVSDEEMKLIKEEFGKKMEQKILQKAQPREAA